MEKNEWLNESIKLCFSFSGINAFKKLHPKVTMVMCLKGYSVNSCGDKYLRIYMESIFASVSSLVIYVWFSLFLFFFQFDFF